MGLVEIIHVDMLTHMCAQKGNEKDLVIDSCLHPGSESKGCTQAGWQGSDGEDSHSELISSALWGATGQHSLEE